MRPSRSFVGRTTELQEIHEYFASHKVRGDLACVVIHGLGGQGKTQTALAYCHNYRDTYDATFLIHAETHERINASLHSIAKELRSASLLKSSPAPSPDGELSLEVDLAREWFEATNLNWLLVFDNIEDASLIETCVPKNLNGRGSIIITTQRAHIDPITQDYKKLELQPLTKLDGSLLFFRILERSSRDDEDESTVQEICDWVGGLPLAIVTVAGYLKRSYGTASQILAGLNRSSQIWESKNESIQNYEKTLTTVFDLALAGVSERSRHLLNLLAFLSPDGVPAELLTQRHSVKSLSFLRHYRYLDILSDLSRRQLVKWQVQPDGSHSIQIHRSLQRNLLLGLATSYDTSLRMMIFNEVTTILTSVLPKASRLQVNEKDLWPLFTRYAPQVLALRQNSQWPTPAIIFDFPFAQMLSNIGTFLWHTGQIRECASAMDTAESIMCKQTREIQSTTEFAEVLSDIFLVTGILADCIGVSRRQQSLEHRLVLLELRKRELASKPSTEVTVEDEIRWCNAKGDLACAYLQRNQFGESRAIMEELYKYYTKWGSEDQYPFEYGKYYHHLSYVLMAEGDPEGAISFCRRGLQLDEAHAGSVDSTVLTSRYDLACLLFNAGRLEESLVEHQEVLKLRLDVCGKGSQLVLESHEAVGILLHLSGNDEEAEEHFKSCLDNRYRVKWTEEGVARARYWYSKVLRGLGKNEAANKQLQSAAEIKDRLLRTYPEFIVEDEQYEPGVYDQMLPIWILQTSGPLQEGGRQKICYSSQRLPGRIDDEAAAMAGFIKATLTKFGI